MMDISFVVPCYNAEKTIKRCLDSILSQELATYKFEIIVVNNNSTDSSQKIILSYSNKVYYLNESKQGRSFARNLGASRAKGEVLAFIDADVYLDKNWAITLIEAFKEDQNIGAGQGQIIPCQDIGVRSLNRYRYRCVNEETKGRFILTEIKRFEFPMINTAACMYRKNVFNDIGGFDVHLERHEDIDLSRRAYFYGKSIACSTEAVAHVIFHGESWSDYFKRSFDDGYYKGAYLKKWSNMPLTLDECLPSQKREFIKWIYAQLLKSFKNKSVHDFLVLLLSMTNAYGRLYGRLNYYYPRLKPHIKISKNGFGKVYIDQKSICE